MRNHAGFSSLGVSCKSRCSHFHHWLNSAHSKVFVQNITVALMSCSILFFYWMYIVFCFSFCVCVCFVCIFFNSLPCKRPLSPSGMAVQCLKDGVTVRAKPRLSPCSPSFLSVIQPVSPGVIASLPCLDSLSLLPPPFFLPFLCLNQFPQYSSRILVIICKTSLS